VLFVLIRAADDLAHASECAMMAPWRRQYATTDQIC
jgi:hypothetical protein